MMYNAESLPKAKSAAPIVLGWRVNRAQIHRNEDVEPKTAHMVRQEISETFCQNGVPAGASRSLDPAVQSASISRLSDFMQE